MSNLMKVVEHEKFGQIRIVDNKGEPWFVARDVALALGYARPSRAIRMHCKRAEVVTPQDGGTEIIEVFPSGVAPKIIPESDVYHLVMQSKLPYAMTLQDWVCEEVLPSIRKYGFYAHDTLALENTTFDQLGLVLQNQLSFYNEIKLQKEEQQRQAQIVSIHETRLSKIESDKEEAEKQLTLIEMTSEKPKEKTLRRKITDVVRAFCLATSTEFRNCWHKIYAEFNSRYNMNVQLRAKNRGIKPIDVIENEGMLDELYKVVCLVCAN